MLDILQNICSHVKLLPAHRRVRDPFLSGAKQWPRGNPKVDLSRSVDSAEDFALHPTRWALVDVPASPHTMAEAHVLQFRRIIRPPE